MAGHGGCDRWRVQVVCYGQIGLQGFWNTAVCLSNSSCLPLGSIVASIVAMAAAVAALNQQKAQIKQAIREAHNVRLSHLTQARSDCKKRVLEISREMKNTKKRCQRLVLAVSRMTQHTTGALAYGDLGDLVPALLAPAGPGDLGGPLGPAPAGPGDLAAPLAPAGPGDLAAPLAPAGPGDLAAPLAPAAPGDL